MEGNTAGGTLLCEHAPGHTTAEEAIKNLRNDHFHLSGQEGGGTMLDDSPPSSAPPHLLKLLFVQLFSALMQTTGNTNNNDPEPEEWH